ncbi:hypothetical protein [Nocardia cyriacigeorgica]|uniref:hypothetical protein n=1 Tax=Nocardia cyriacigeorgica TaxID=135487 RepID=UPI002456DBCC|nr:hypothetical protein [Nocardia cyriacigeorgica]
MRIAVTGHMNITLNTAKLVYDRIVQELNGHENLVGVSCVARGADSVFAQAVLDCGGQLEVVLPSRNYRERKVKPDHAELFDRLLASAASVHAMDFDDAGRDAYEAANAQLILGADRLIAVWDGQVSERGGTGTVVDLARNAGIPVEIVWPEGAQRN